MAQHDYNLANQSGADFRADLNNALEAIATVNSGATEPSTTFAHQLWVDTANSVLKIRNAANSDWITFGVSISSSNVLTGNLTGDVTGNVTGDVTGNVTGDLTGNADSADILSTARTIQISGDVAGSASFDGSGDINIATTVQIDSIVLGTDTQGDYIESISGSTGVTITDGTGEGSTPTVAIGQPVATTDDVTFNIVTATNEFVGDIDGAIRFTAKADEALSKGDVVYVSGVSGNTTTVGKAKADDASKMPAFGMAIEDANANNNLQIVTFGNLTSIDTSNESVGQILYVSTTAGEYTTTAPTGESSQIQNIGKVLRSHAVNGSIKVGGAGRSNATPNLDDGKIFIGNGSNQSSTSTLDTSIVPENTNLYWTTARGESMFDTRLATKDTGDLAEGSNLYYTTARVNSDFDTRLATKDTDSLSEGVSNLYYTTTRVNSDFDTRLATKDTSDLTEGSNLYYTTARANSDFDTRLATKSTTNLAEGTNLYYTDARFDTRLATKDTDDLTEGTNLYYTSARFDSAFTGKSTSDLSEGTNLYYTDARANSAIDSRVTKTFVDNLGVVAGGVQANSVTLGTDTTGNYIQTITGTANKITVTGSGSESADVTLTLPNDVQIADSLTVAGNLTVNGTLTSLDTTNLDIEDNLFQLNAGLTGSPVNDSGMLINRGNQDNGIFMWDESADKFTLGLTTADGSATGNITLNSLGTLVANIEGAVTGNVTGTVSDVSNHDTDDIGEGSSNLYYTDARADARVNLQTGANLDLSSKSTSDLSEGTNEYFTTARARSSISATGDIAYNSSTGVISFTASAAPVTSVNTLTGAVVLDSDDIAEGSTNLYYTDARARAAISESSTQLAYNSTTGVLTYTQGDTDTVSEGTSNLYYTTSRFDAAFSGKSTSDLSEGTNLYYTDARAQAVSINNVVEDTTPQLGGDLASNGNDILFADNDKAIFGAGSDLQIYHDGSNSYFADTGTGVLNIESNGTQINLQKPDGTKMIEAINNGNVVLYSNGTERLRVNGTGIDVTGEVQADTLDIDGIADISSTLSTGNILNVRQAGTGAATIQLGQNRAADGNSYIDFLSDATNPYSFRVIRVPGVNGAVNLTQAGTGDFVIKTADAADIVFQTNNTERVRLDSAGKLLVGSTTDYEGRVQIAANNEAGLFVRDSNTTNNAPYVRVQGQRSDGNTNKSFSGGLVLEAYNTGAKVPNNKILGTIYFGGNHTNGTESNISYAGTIAGIAEGAFNSVTDMPTGLAFFTGDAGSALKTPSSTYGTERLRISHDGFVGINTTAPATLLHIKADSNSATDFPITIENAADSLDVGIGAYGLSNKVGTSQTSDFTMTIGDDLYLAADTVRLPDGADLIVQENDSTTSAIRLTSDTDEGFLQVYRAGVQKVQIRGNGDNYIIDNNFGINQSAPTQQLVVKDATVYHGILVHGNNAPNISFDRGDTQTPEWKVGVSGNTGTSFAISKGTANDDKLTIASDGNTSIGTTSTNRKLTVTGSSTSQGTIYAYTNEVHTGTDTNAHVSIRSDNASASGDVLHVRGDGSGNLLTIDKSGTEKLVVDSSGNVGIGTSSPLTELHVYSANQDALTVETNTGINQIHLSNSTNSPTYITQDSYSLIFKADENGWGGAASSMQFKVKAAERMRIGSAGNVSIGTTANIGVLGVKQYSQSATTFRLDSFSGSGRWFYLPNGNYGYQGSEKIYANGGRNRNFVNATGTQVGSIQINSGSTAFNTTSDYRLKDNPQPLTGSGEFIDALQPKTWTWNHSDGGTGVGFIAHEAAEAGLGLCVSGEKDEVGLDKVVNDQTGKEEEQVVPKYQQVDYSNSELIANMVAELQSLRARIADLENQ